MNTEREEKETERQQTYRTNPQKATRYNGAKSIVAMIMEAI